MWCVMGCLILPEIVLRSETLELNGGQLRWRFSLDFEKVRKLVFDNWFLIYVNLVDI